MNPDIKDLQKEYTRAGGYNQLSFRRTKSDDVRFAKWAGQNDDGKKHANDANSEPFPWEGASDTRVRLADQIINENVDILSTSFWRGVLRASPTEANDNVFAIVTPIAAATETPVPEESSAAGVSVAPESLPPFVEAWESAPVRSVST